MSRKHYTPEEKAIILKQQLLDKVSVSDLCDQHGPHPTVFQWWMKEFPENAAPAVQKDKDTRSLKLENKMAKLEGKPA